MALASAFACSTSLSGGTLAPPNLIPPRTLVLPSPSSLPLELSRELRCAAQGGALAFLPVTPLVLLRALGAAEAVAPCNLYYCRFEERK